MHVPLWGASAVAAVVCLPQAVKRMARQILERPGLPAYPGTRRCNMVISRLVDRIYVDGQARDGGDRPSGLASAQRLVIRRRGSVSGAPAHLLASPWLLQELHTAALLASTAVAVLAAPGSLLDLMGWTCMACRRVTRELTLGVAARWGPGPGHPDVPLRWEEANENPSPEMEAMQRGELPRGSWTGSQAGSNSHTLQTLAPAPLVCDMYSTQRASSGGASVLCHPTAMCKLNLMAAVAAGVHLAGPADVVGHGLWRG